MKLRVVAIGLLAAAPLAAIGSLVGLQQVDCPSVANIRSYKPPQATRVYAMDGSLVADLSPQRRVIVELTDISPDVVDGFVAVEDRRFWEHGGIDYRGVGRAIVRDIASLSMKEGFSTITMQLVRNVFPDELPFGAKIRRKACEVKLSRQMEDALTKREILKLYINQVYMGNGLYGVEAASQSYFGKSAKMLTTAESALLVGLVKNPEGYNPRKSPTRAISRRNVVLDVMAREGVITDAAAANAKAQKIALAPPMEPVGSAPYFIAAIRRELKKRFGDGAEVAGLRVFTGLDPDLQRAATKALVAHIEKIESGHWGRYRHPVPDSGSTAAASGASPYLQGMVVALEPRTGVVRALVGGRDFSLTQFDRAFQAKRQPGSAFKPFVMAAALAAGLPITSRFETSSLVVDDAGSPAWEPSDHVADSVGALPLREILAVSSNLGTVRVGQWVGVDRVAETARSLGISTPIPRYPSTFLGAADVIPAEIVAAFAAFGNGGVRVRPNLIERVEDTRGKVLWRAPIAREQVLDPGVAYLTLSMMEDVVDHGTGAVVRSAGFWLPAAGKTGTTNGAKDNWFIGLTPDLVAGVWVGFDDPKVIQAGASGSRFAAPVWAEMMKAAYADRAAPAPWTPPANLVSMPVDMANGLAATANCPPEAVRIEYFMPGTEPHEYCPLHPDNNPNNAIQKLWRGFKNVF